MSSPHLEELAALHGAGLLDEAAQAELFSAMEQDVEVRQLVRDYAETAALMAYAAPQVQPPPELKRALLHKLPSPKAESRFVHFSTWMPYAIAACLMFLGIYQARQIFALKARLQVVSEDAGRLRESNALMGLRLTALEAKDASYGSAKVMVAWDAYQHRGVISLQNLPQPQPGHDYQLWVLDPNAEAPISAGVIPAEAISRSFTVRPLSMGSPGFAISLEPLGGRPSPTGPILLAVAPSP